jgi:hypothetical protein
VDRRWRTAAASILASLLFITLLLVAVLLLGHVGSDHVDCGTVLAPKVIGNGGSFADTFNSCSSERFARRNQALLLAVVSLVLGLALAKVVAPALVAARNDGTGADVARRHRTLAGLAAIGTQAFIAVVVSLLPLSPVGSATLTASPRFIFSICAELACGAVIGLAFPRAFAGVALFLVPTVLVASFALAFATPGEDGPGNFFSLVGAAIFALVIFALFFLGYGAGYAVRSFLRRWGTAWPSNALATD